MERAAWRRRPSPRLVSLEWSAEQDRRHMQMHAATSSTTPASATELLFYLAKGEPQRSLYGDWQTGRFDLVVPPGAYPGRRLVVRMNGRDVAMSMPNNKLAGDRIRFKIDEEGKPVLAENVYHWQVSANPKYTRVRVLARARLVRAVAAGRGGDADTVFSCTSSAAGAGATVS